MIDLLQVREAQRTSLFGRASPVLKLAVAVVWLLALALTVDARAPLTLIGAALLAGHLLGRIPTGRFAARLAPLWTAALGIGLFNALFAAANADPTSAEMMRFGPVRLTEPALLGGAAIALRVLAIASVGVVFGLTTTATGLVDSLVQQARIPARFGYGALAAFQAIPRFADDLITLRQARRIRGLRAGWHPRLLVGLLVLAIRHGSRLALSMDARAFGSGPRTAFRLVRWGPADAAVLAGGLGALVAAMAATLIR